jgi:CO/xanthine dehydrogenase Mo-binding subunit
MGTESYIGRSVPRKDGEDKVRGKLRYLGDRFAPEMLHAAVKTSPHAHALLTKIDIDAALQAPGVRAVLTGADIPEILVSILVISRPWLTRKFVTTENRLQRLSPTARRKRGQHCR